MESQNYAEELNTQPHDSILQEDSTQYQQAELSQKGLGFLIKKYFSWIVLVVALFSVSSAAAVLRMINVPNLLHDHTIGFMYEWKTSSQEIRTHFLQRKVLLILCGSGVSLAIHFGCWIWSLDFTSLDHSLLFVTAHPLVLVAGHYLLRVLRISPSMPSIGEAIGSVIGFIGMGITVMDVRNVNSEATLIGDSFAFIGAIGIIVYLLAGRNLRSWMPLFLYAFPVTSLAALLLSLASFFEPNSPKQLIFFGWMTDWKWLGLVLYVGFCPGILGHTGINFILKYLHPLIVSVTLLLEPLIGSSIGYVLGVAPLPGSWTLLGAPVIILGLLTVTVSASRRNKNELKKLETEEEKLNTFEENEPVELDELA